jgi:hypothetical protein
MLDRLLIALRLKPRPFNMTERDTAVRKARLRYYSRSNMSLSRRLSGILFQTQKETQC